VQCMNWELPTTNVVAYLNMRSQHMPMEVDGNMNFLRRGNRSPERLWSMDTPEYEQLNPDIRVIFIIAALLCVSFNYEASQNLNCM
jgi:hypothetical protein